MTIPFRVKRLTDTAKLPHRNCESDLWDLFADDFDYPEDVYNLEKIYFDNGNNPRSAEILPQGRILVKTGIAIELPVRYKYIAPELVCNGYEKWHFKQPKSDIAFFNLEAYAVADIRPRSGLSLKHGITVLNTPGTIDNSYRKEIGVILYNAGHEPYTITKGDKIAQMLIRPLYPSSFEEVKDFEDTGRGGFGSTGK